MGSPPCPSAKTREKFTLARGYKRATRELTRVPGHLGDHPVAPSLSKESSPATPRSQRLFLAIGQIAADAVLRPRIATSGAPPSSWSRAPSQSNAGLPLGHRRRLHASAAFGIVRATSTFRP